MCCKNTTDLFGKTMDRQCSEVEIMFNCKHKEAVITGDASSIDKMYCRESP